VRAERTRNKKAATDGIERLLTSALTVCYLSAQVGEPTMVNLFAKASRKAKSRAALLKPNTVPSVGPDITARVIGEWTRNPKYLDDDARPLPITMRGASPSIESLFKDLGLTNYFVDGLKCLKATKLIVKSDARHYLPSGEANVVPPLAPELFAHIAETINRLVATVLWNTAKKRDKSARLIERSTFVEDLAEKDREDFLRFTREQGAALVSTVNDWLESRRTSRLSKKMRRTRVLTAGFHVFSYTDKESKG
jgi:hypothetical protein